MLNSVTRLLLTLGLSAGTWFGADYLTSQYALPEALPYAATGVVALVTWLLAGRVLSAAKNTMAFVEDPFSSPKQLPSARPARAFVPRMKTDKCGDKPADKCTDKPADKCADKPADKCADKPAAKPSDKKEHGKCIRAGGCLTPGAPCSGQSRILAQTTRLQIEVKGEEDGTIKVIVDAKVSGSDFKGIGGSGGLRGRLESVPGVKWAFPKNVDGTRHMEGIVARTSYTDAAAALQAIAQKYL